MVGVLERLRVAMKIRNLDPSSLTGHVTRTTSPVLKTHKWAGAINAGATRGTSISRRDKANELGTTQKKTSTDENSTSWKIKSPSGQKTFMYKNLKYGYKIEKE